jgi:hypothetical protein
MTGPSLTTRRGRGRGRGGFSCPNGGNVQEDRGSSGRGSDGNNWTLDNRRSGEECNDRSTLPAMAVILLDSVKQPYRCRGEGGGMAEQRDGNG